MTGGGVRRALRALALVLLAVVARDALADVPSTIARIKGSVVAIGTYERTRNQPFQFLGTGFAVGDGTLVLTSAHALPPAADPRRPGAVSVLSPAPARDGREQAELREGRAVLVDPAMDVAVLKIDGPPLPALRLRDSDGVRDGYDVMITGFPLGATLGPIPVTSRAMVAAITPVAVAPTRAADVDTSTLRRLSSGSFTVFQLDTVAYPGASGSPAYDPASGEVLGMVNVAPRDASSAAPAPTASMPYAIPSRELRTLLERARGPGPNKR
jgi:S1-C subfamily serine protease